MTFHQRHRLFRRMCAVMLGILVLAVVIPQALTIGYEDRLFRRNVRERAVATANTAALVVSDSVAAGDRDALTRFVVTLAHENPDIKSAFVADQEGLIIAHSDPNKEGSRLASLGTQVIETSVRNQNGEDGSRLLEVRAPVRVSGEPWGTFCFSLSLLPIEAEIHAAMMRVLLSGGIFLLLGAIGAGWLARSVAEPVGELAALAQAVALGDLHVRAQIRSRDEIAGLATSFNAMVESLRHSREQIEKHKEVMERTVHERTAQLRHANIELRTAQHQLVQAEKLSALGQLVSGVAHELNNPLAAVIGFAEYLHDWADTPGPVRAKVAVIRKEADRCRRIVQDLLIFSRSRRIVPRPVDLNRIVREALDSHRVKLEEAAIGVEFALEDSLAVVHGDAHMLQQVLVNLIGNAIDSIGTNPRPGHIRISTLNEPGEVKVVLADNGPGIRPEIMNRIFEPFFTTKEVGKGTGLGLALCYGIVQEHRGRIEVTSNPSGGATFSISLPAAGEEARETTQSDPSLAGPARPEPSARAARGENAPLSPSVSRLAPARPLNVLVVEDQSEIANLIEETLTLIGHRVSKVGNGSLALERLRSERFDLIVSDIKMPGLDGPGLHAQIKSAWPDMLDRIVFITGDQNGETTRAFLDETGAACIGKPFQLCELEEILAEVACATACRT